MNVGDDIAQLSYKELQALALRYRVPGNIKKKLLVKVLQAARTGNEAEFSRLLQELRKTRKRKMKKSKEIKIGITSTPLHSPDYIMTDDDYYYQAQQPQQQQQQQQQPPQQQPPYQWIGAEEEIVSRDDDKIPHYEEFKQFLLKRIQREFQTCDANNNQIQDLRTTAMSPNVQSMSLDIPSYPQASLINDADPLAIATIDRPIYQVLKEPEGSSQGPFLLKRMLQAPVGANLGEIASSLFWASNLLDNSDTLTAESENEDQLEAAANANEYYGLLKNARNEFLLNEANLRNMEALVPQTSGMLAGEDHYRYPSDVDNRQSYQNWMVANEMELPETDLPSSKVYHAIYYSNNADSGTAANVADNLPYQYQTNSETTCNGAQNFLNFDYATGADTMAPNDNSHDIYHLQNLGKSNNGEQIGAGYFRNESHIHSNAQQNIYANGQQMFSDSVRGASDVTYQYLYPRFTQEMDNALHERLEDQQLDGNITTGIESSINQQATNMQGSTNGTMEPFWPKWTAQASKNLENILNYHVSKQVDYAKLSQTSCVYCYVAPIVSQRSSLANNTCSQMRRYSAEQRQHSFSPYWMLYNDTAQGMRMMNMPGNPPE